MALGRDAIASVQQVALPLLSVGAGDWARGAIEALESVSDVAVPATGELARFMRPSSPRATLGRELGHALAGRLPVNLRRQFESAVSFSEREDLAQWANRASACSAWSKSRSASCRRSTRRSRDVSTTSADHVLYGQPCKRVNSLPLSGLSDILMEDKLETPLD